MAIFLIDEDTVIVQTADLVAAQMDGETVMMRIENGKYYGIDAVGSRIWELIASPRRVLEIVGVLAKEYDVEVGQCKADTLDFLNHLYREGLVRLE